VIGYDAVALRVKLSDGWGYEKTFPVSDVWLAPAKADSKASRRRVLAILGAGVGAGALIGSIITTLLLR
jgi:hypothetical protein